MDLERIATATPVHRREVLGAMAGAGAALLLGACGADRNPGDRDPTPASAGLRTPGPSGDVEDSLALYGWPDSVNPDSIDLFKARSGVTTFRYDVCADGEELRARLRRGATGHDLATPSAEDVPGLVADGLVSRLDVTRIPNSRFINPLFRGRSWDPTNAYQVPKDYGTTGILVRQTLVPEPLTSWRQFRELIMSDRYSGRTVFVDSMRDVLAFPLKMLGASLNSVAKGDLDAARRILLEVAPHLAALDSVGYGERLRTGEAVLALGWAAPLAALRADPAAGDTTYVVPSEGTLFWLDTWALLAGAPHPNAAYAWLDFIHDPEIQANETNYTGHATPNDAARDLVDPDLLADPAVFPPAAVLGRLEGAEATSANTQRLDVWEEFRSKVRQG